MSDRDDTEAFHRHRAFIEGDAQSTVLDCVRLRDAPLDGQALERIQRAAMRTVEITKRMITLQSAMADK